MLRHLPCRDSLTVTRGRLAGTDDRFLPTSCSHRLPGQPLTHSSAATSQANFTHPSHSMTLRFLPQVVCRTKFRGAAIFGTPISLRSHEPSPLLRVSIYQSKSKLYKAVIFAMILVMFVFNTSVLSCLCSFRSLWTWTYCRRRTATGAQRWAAHRLYHRQLL